MYLKHAANLCSSVGSLDIQFKIRRPSRKRYRAHGSGCHVAMVAGVELMCRNIMRRYTSSEWGWTAAGELYVRSWI